MPEGQELDLPALWMFGISGLLFWGSVILWIVWLVKRSNAKCDPSPIPLRPWAVGWINFGIFLCGIVTLIILLQLVVGTFVGPFLGDEEGNLNPWALALGALTMQSALLLAYVIGRKRFPMLFRGNLSSVTLSLPKALWAAFPRFVRYFLIIGIVTYLWTTLLTRLVALGILEEFSPQAAVLIFGAGESPIALTLLALFAVILAPIAEEIIFRGCIYRFLKSKMATHRAMLASGFFFAIIHSNLMALVPLTLVGFFLAYIYEKERNILVPICFHAFFNFLTLSMTTLRSLSALEFPY